jgi:hypothetical protein
MFRIVEQFTVQADDGTRYEVVVTQKFHKAGDQFIPGIKELRTAYGGYHLNRIDDNTFEIVELGQVVRRVR